MSRSLLMVSFSTAAIAAFAAATPAANAKVITYLQGGGATSPQGDYAGPNSGTTATSELSTYNASSAAVKFGSYWGSGATGQTAFLNNDLTCDTNKVTGANSGGCSNTPGGADAVHYNFSDSTLTPTQIAQWASSSWGQSAAGNLIQIPTLGTGQAILVNDTNIKTNGQLQLSTNDLCEIFSGGYTDFSQITDSATAPAAGAFKLVYRSDASAATFILTEYLANACTSANTNPGVTYAGTTTFTSIFPGGAIASYIPGAVAQKGSAGVANYLSGLSGGAVPQAIGYVSPDWTSIPPAPDSFLSNGQTSKLVVASIVVGGTAWMPNVTGITKALLHVASVAPGTPTQPPLNATAAANPTNWVPVIASVSTGYPIVGYGTLEVAQCYANPKIAAVVIKFLDDHYKLSAYQTIQANNGLVKIANSGATKFASAVQKDLLANVSGWNVNIQNATACAGLPGR